MRILGWMLLVVVVIAGGEHPHAQVPVWLFTLAVLAIVACCAPNSNNL